ncbi:MAG: RNA polymerase sigma factor [Bacteroidia bacterium]
MEQRLIDLLNQHRGIAFKIARLYTDQQADQQDLYQEMVYQTLSAWHRFQGKSQFSTWFYRICLNTALSWQRNEKKRSAAEADTELLVATHDPLRQAQSEWLYHHMRRLEPLSRMVLSLKLDGYNMQEIADITGLTINNATVKAHRAKNQLTQWLQENPLSI